MHGVHPGLTFLNQGLRYQPRPDATHLPAKMPIPTDKITSATKPISRPETTTDSNPNPWKATGWETNIPRNKPDGKFGPAKQIASWSDSWFMASLAAIENDQDGRKILAQSIKKANTKNLRGYYITFAGMPNDAVFISDEQLSTSLDAHGGDADTRLLELAADKFFADRGNYQALGISYYLKAGQNLEQAKKSFQQECGQNQIQDPLTYNPVRTSGMVHSAFFLLTGLVCEKNDGGLFMWESTIMKFLHQHLTRDLDGSSLVLVGKDNPLGPHSIAPDIVSLWDRIRTDITYDPKVNPQEKAFLKALDKWLRTDKYRDLSVLKSAAHALKLKHAEPAAFVDKVFAIRPDLGKYQLEVLQSGVDVLRSGVKNILNGGTGYIGIPGGYCESVYGINEMKDTFSYADPNVPDVVHTGRLSDLISAIRWRRTILRAVEPKNVNTVEPQNEAYEEDYREAEDLLRRLKRRTPDGRFGPAMQKTDWSDSWFLACLAAVAKDQDGQKKLAQSITKTNIQGINGYYVTFAGLPNIRIFISNRELDKCLDADGGDADTRVLELAADRFFAVRGKFKSMCLSYYLKAGQNQDQAEKSFQEFCSDNQIKDPMTYNPMRTGGFSEFGFFLLAGIDSQSIKGGLLTWKSTISKFLQKHLSNDPDGASVVIQGQINPLGSDRAGEDLVDAWDAIRADITSDGTVNQKERAFLKALDQWIETNKSSDFTVLKSAAAKLTFKLYDPARFVDDLIAAQRATQQLDFYKLGSSVKDLLFGGTGYIGIAGGHTVTLHGINEAQDTFTYTVSKYPNLVLSGRLSDLITAIQQKSAILRAAEPETEKHKSHKKGEPQNYEEYRDDEDLLEQLKLRTPDGKFSPSRQRANCNDSWFLSCLAAVAKAKDGQKKLAQSIKKARVDGVSGHYITFAGLPDVKIFISDEVLENCLDTYGGDGDTRLMELAADRLFSENDNFKSLYLAYYLKAGQHADQAEASFKEFCRDNSIKNPRTYNPMDGGPHTELGFFLLAGSGSKLMTGSFFTWASTIMQFLYQYLSKNPDGAAVVIDGRDNPLGPGHFTRDLVVGWDAIRTDITSDGTVNQQERAVLKALDQWLTTNESRDYNVLKSAASDLKLQHVKLDRFLYNLAVARPDMKRRCVSILRNGVRELLSGGSGYIGFAGGHAGILHGINSQKNKFTYTEPYFPTMVHTGKLSDLITAIKYKYASLRAVESENDKYEKLDPNDEL